MVSLIGTLVVGLVVGLLARAFKPGDDKLGWIMTALLGVAGSFLASYLGLAMGWYQQGIPLDVQALAGVVSAACTPVPGLGTVRLLCRVDVQAARPATAPAAPSAKA